MLLPTAKQMTISPPLTWLRIKGHALIYGLGLEGGDGLQLPLRILSRGADLIEDNGWKEELQALEEVIRPLKFALSPSPQSLLDRRIERLYSLCEELRKLPPDEYKALARIFCLHILISATSQKRCSPDFLHGLTQIAKSWKAGTTSDWGKYWPILRNEVAQLPHHASNKKTADFGALLAPLLNTRIPSPNLTNTIRLIRLGVEQENGTPQETATATATSKPSAGTQRQHTAPEPKQQAPSTPAKEWTWRDFVQSKAAFSSTGARLGLNTWDDLPLEHVLSITHQCARDLREGNLMDRTAAALALLSFISGASAKHVVHLEFTDQPAGVGIDIACECLLLDRRLLLKPQKNSVDDSDPAYVHRIPLPLILSQAIKSWLFDGPAASLADVLPPLLSGKSVARICTYTDEYIKALGDPHLLAWPGKWAASGAKTYLHVLGNDLLSSVCSLSPQLSSSGSHYYFHPSPKDLTDACSEVYRFLGLGEANTAALSSPNLPSVSPVRVPSALTQGFDQLMGDFIKSCTACIEHGPNLQIEAFNKVTVLAASLVVFLCGGRGSRTEQLKVGSIFLDNALLHLYDKDVEDERGSRLLPKVPAIHLVLQWYLGALKSFALDAVDSVHHNDRKTWRELGDLALRPDAHAFQKVVHTGTSLAREPIEPKDIEKVSQEYFGQPKNFMRSNLITHWVRARADPNLLRVITGHSHDRLDLPGSMSVCAPTSVIQAAGAELEKVSSTWFHVAKFPLLPFQSKPTFISLSLGRLHKSHQLYSRALSESGTACHFGRWHLVANRLIPPLRKRLIDQALLIERGAGVLLHFALVELLHFESDLQIALSSGTLQSRVGGVSLQWRRAGERVDCLIPLQLPTTLYLKSNGIASLAFEYEESSRIAGEWLLRQLAELGEFTDTVKVNKSEIEKPGAADSRLEASALRDAFTKMCSAVRLWADLRLPGINQFGFNPSNHCVQPEPSSLQALLAPGIQQVKLDYRLDREFERIAQSEDQITLVLEALKAAADPRMPEGGDKRRKTVYENRLLNLNLAGDESWAALLDTCIRIGFDILIHKRADQIAPSTMVKYLMVLLPRLVHTPTSAPAEMTDLDFTEFANNLKVHITDRQNAENDKKRADYQRSAAHWLLHRMKDAGLAVPPSVFEYGKHALRRPTHCGIVVHINASQHQAVQQILAHQAVHVSSLTQLRAEAALSALTAKPMRWGELATVKAADLSTKGSYLYVRESDFQHIKSDNAWRHLATGQDLSAKLWELFQSVTAIKKRSARDAYLFMDYKDGLDDETEEVPSIQAASQIHRALTLSLKIGTANANVRVHNLRARAACEIAFPNWENLLGQWLLAQAGPIAVAKYFEYEPDRAWRVEQARSDLGHGVSSTSALYYLYNLSVVRALAVCATLADLEAAPLCKVVGVTPDALRKSMVRNDAVSADPWLYFQKKLVDAEPRADPKKATETSSSISNPEPPTVVSRKESVRYFCLRMLDVSSSDAVAKCNLSARQGDLIESLFQRMDRSVADSLRSRQKGATGGRAREGDLGVLESGFFETLYNAWGHAPKEVLRDIDTFWEGTGDVDSWKDRLPKLLSKYFLPFGLEVDVVLKRDAAASQNMAFVGSIAGVGSVASVRDQCKHPRIFVFPVRSDPSLVMKSRYLSVARLVCHAFQSA